MPFRLFGAKVDWRASIHPQARIEYPWNISIGKRSSIGKMLGVMR